MKTIMIVEDESTMRAFLRASLQAKGFNIIEAQDFSEGTQLLRSQSVDLILLDADLTERSFETQFPLFRKDQPQLPVLALTIGEGELSKADLLKMGIDDFLSKPFTFPDLLLRIERILSVPMSVCLLSASRNLRVDLEARAVSLGGKIVTLSAPEWDCIQLLCQRVGRVVDEKILGERVLKSVGAGEDPQLLLKMTIWQLRQKLEEDPVQPQMIKTVSGIGYRLEMFA